MDSTATIPVQSLAQTGTPAPTEAAEAGPSGPQQTASWVLLAFGIVILVWVMLRLQWKRQRRSPDDEPVAQMRETLVDRAAESERAAEVAGIVRDMAARLETRAARLEVLLDQADERIEKLEARLAAGIMSENLATPARPGAARPIDHGEPTDPWTMDSDASAKPSNHDPLHHEVYELADGGQTPLDIARRLDQQVGTIELILALRQ